MLLVFDSSECLADKFSLIFLFEKNIFILKALLISGVFFFLFPLGLSYTGDFRMTVGEDKKKVSNIVKPNIDEFREIYTDFLDNDEFTYWNKEEGVMEQSLCGSSRYYHMLNLPLNVQHRLTAMRNMDGRFVR